MNSVAGGVFENLGALTFDDSTHGTYNVGYPDVFNPINGAASALVYNTGGSAAVQYANGCSRVIYSGVPLETIYPASDAVVPCSQRAASSFVWSSPACRRRCICSNDVSRFTDDSVPA